MPKIIFSLNNDRHRIESDLLESEIYAIGYVTAAWAVLEHSIFIITQAMAQEAKISLPEDATAQSFKKRLRAWREVVKETIKNEDVKAHFIKIANRIGSIQRTRHRITHGLWEWEPSKPEKIKGVSYRKPYEFEEPFDFKKLMKLGEKIGEINFLILYPGGKEQAREELIEEHTKRGGFASREFLLSLAGNDLANLHRRIPIPPKRKKPRSSSK